VRPGALIIGSDTIVNDGAGPSYGKPESASDAIAMLRSLRGRTHSVLTGVAVLLDGEASTGRERSPHHAREPVRRAGRGLRRVRAPAR